MIPTTTERHRARTVAWLSVIAATSALLWLVAVGTAFDVLAWNPPLAQMLTVLALAAGMSATSALMLTAVLLQRAVLAELAAVREAQATSHEAFVDGWDLRGSQSGDRVVSLPRPGPAGR